MSTAAGVALPINVPLVAIALAGVPMLVPETAEPGGHRLDLPGTLLVAASLFAIVDAIIEAPGRGWLSGATLAETAAGLWRSVPSSGGSCASSTR